MVPAHGVPDVVSIESLEALSAVLALKEESLPHDGIDEVVLQMAGLAYKDDCREDLEQLEDRVSSSFLGYSTSYRAFLDFQLSTAHFPRAGVVDEGEGEVLEGLSMTTRFLPGSMAEGCIALGGGKGDRSLAHLTVEGKIWGRPRDLQWERIREGLSENVLCKEGLSTKFSTYDKHPRFNAPYSARIIERLEDADVHSVIGEHSDSIGTHT
ncbi:hypothetical protein ACLOJK_038846 [Asimina triloba]